MSQYNQDNIKAIFLAATKGYFTANQNFLAEYDFDENVEAQKTKEFAVGLAKVFSLAIPLSSSARSEFVIQSTQTIIRAISKMVKALEAEDADASEIVKNSLDAMCGYCANQAMIPLRAGANCNRSLIVSAQTPQPPL